MQSLPAVKWSLSTIILETQGCSLKKDKSLLQDCAPDLAIGGGPSAFCVLGPYPPHTG